MILLDVCSSPEVLLIIRMVRNIINIIRIAVPILLIISLMYGFIRPIVSANDELNKELSRGVKKIIAAILVFFIPTFINILLSIAGAKNIGVAECFNNATTQNITQAYLKKAQEYISIANKTISRADYNKAASEVSNVSAQITKLTGDENITDIPKLKNQLKTVEAKVVKKEEEIKKAKEEEEKRKEEERKKQYEQRQQQNNNDYNSSDGNNGGHSSGTFPAVGSGPGEFVAKYYGTAHDYDNGWGLQCVDGFRFFCSVYGLWSGTAPGGNAGGFWEDRYRYTNNFDIITNPKDFRNGDWVIWKEGSGSHPSSHVAMYYNGQEFGQRQSCDKSRSFCLSNTNFNDAAGALRPKIYYKK